ncbi:MAG: ribosome hibernation-promoting factor, HPF/YfiA family [Opitutales bacterium]
MNENEIIISGSNIELTEAMKGMVKEKAAKLFEHEEQIVRMRVQLEYDPHQVTHQKEFIAKGHLELRGNNPNATGESDSMYKSIDDMVHKLDRMLRRRSRKKKVKRKDTHDVDIPAEIPKAM